MTKRSRAIAYGMLVGAGNRQRRAGRPTAGPEAFCGSGGNRVSEQAMVLGAQGRRAGEITRTSRGGRLGECRGSRLLQSGFESLSALGPPTHIFTMLTKECL